MKDGTNAVLAGKFDHAVGNKKGGGIMLILHDTCQPCCGPILTSLNGIADVHRTVCDGEQSLQLKEALKPRVVKAYFEGGMLTWHSAAQ